MSHKCYISFKTEDLSYKLFLQNELKIDMVDKSLNEPINSINDDYIMRVIREEYLADSTVTIFLIGTKSAELFGVYEQRFIKRELQASLYNGERNTRNEILGIVLPEMTNQVYLGNQTCSVCGCPHDIVKICDSTVIREFSYNYFLPTEKCSWSEDDRYCVLARWQDFVVNPEAYIEAAFAKRAAPIANRVRVRP